MILLILFKKIELYEEFIYYWPYLTIAG